MKLFKAIKISRPIGYIIGPLVFLIPISLYSISFDIVMLIQLMILTFPLCFLLFGINDVYDIGTDKKNPRKGGIDGTILKEGDIRNVLNISAVCAGLMFVPALLRPNVLNLAATSLLVFFAYAYSAPPIRLKEKPPLDSLSNAVIIYLIFLLGLSCGPGIVGFPEKGYYLLFGVMGVHIFSTIMDYSPDINSRVKTFSTVFGKRFAAMMSFSIAGFILLFSGIESWLINAFMGVFCLISIISLINPVERLAAIMFRILLVLFIVLGIGYLIHI